MEKYGIKISNYKCFKEPIGFDEIKPINVIIGKNNIGKSSLIDMIEFNYNKELFFNACKQNNNLKLIIDKTISENDFVRNRNQYYSGNVLSVSDFTNLWKNGDTVQSEIPKDSVICTMQNKVFTNKIENKYFVPIEYYKKK